MIGIGITTRNRPKVFKKTLNMIKKYVPVGSKIVVVDDSDDNKRKGIARAKNECLAQLDDCDHIFLFDDDVYPIKKGWCNLYIEASDFANINFFSLTTMSDNSFFEVQKVIDYSTYSVTFKDFEPILTTSIKIETIKSLRQQLGLTYNYPYVTECINSKKIKFHLHPNGFMLYINQKCLQMIGGFNEEFDTYGGEHGNYAHRAKNTGMTPHWGADVFGSEEYFYSYDQHKAVESTVKPDKARDHKNTSLFEREVNSTKYCEYRFF